MDLTTKLTIIGIIVTTIISIIFGIPGYISIYYARRDHNKKNQDLIIHKEHVLSEKNKVKKVLLEFINDWNSYSKSDQIYSNEDAQYLVFIKKEKLDYYIDQFLFISNEIKSIGILPDVVSEKLIDFAARMRPISDRSNIVSSDAWSRKYPSSLVNQFDELLADIRETYENLDEICSTA